MLRKFALSAATTVVLTTSMITAAHAKSCWFQGFNPFSKDISERPWLCYKAEQRMQSGKAGMFKKT